MSSDIVMIGSGKVATHLSQRLQTVGHRLLHIHSRDLQKAQLIAQKVGATASNDFEALPKNADIYIIAVSDNAIAEVAATLAKYLPRNVFVAHTSGSVSRAILQPYFPNSGVCYPLQTFSYEKTPNFETLPLCIDAETTNAKEYWLTFGKTICPNTHFIDDEARAKLHIAAVLVNNFSNMLFIAAYDILSAEQIDFRLLLPLVEETIDKLHHITPEKAQTGPAIRKDTTTIERHLHYLDTTFPAYAQVYRLLTESIQLRMQPKS